MIINPLALASKGYIGNSLSITIAFKGQIDLEGGTPPPPSGDIRYFQPKRQFTSAYVSRVAGKPKINRIF